MSDLLSEKDAVPEFKDFHGFFHIHKVALVNTLMPVPLPQGTDYTFVQKRKVASISFALIHILSETKYRYDPAQSRTPKRRDIGHCREKESRRKAEGSAPARWVSPKNARKYPGGVNRFLGAEELNR